MPISPMFSRAPELPEADAKAKAILDLETRSPAFPGPRREKRDPVKGYNLMTRDALEAYAPGFCMGRLLDEAGFGDVKEMVLSTDTSVQALAKLFGQTDVETMKDYLTYHYIDFLAPCCPKTGRTPISPSTARSCRNRRAGFVSRTARWQPLASCWESRWACLCQSLLPRRLPRHHG